jgi:thioredoxin reductase (NADPH)
MACDDTECLVIGGGPAGLTAALYLGRFRRKVILVDNGFSRASWIPKTHNLIGFPQGISGPELLADMRAQADLYNVRRVSGQVDVLNLTEIGFEARIGDTVVNAGHVLFATGGLDVEPELADIRDAVKTGLVRYCPICDAFEAKGRRIALIAYGKCRLREAMLLRAYTADLTVLTLGRPMRLLENEEQTMRDAGIKIVNDPIIKLERAADDIAVWPRHASAPLLFDVLYSALGTRVRSQLALDLGAKADEDGALIVDAHQRTTVSGLYAAGDVVRGLSQISIAAAQAAIAATAINAELPPLKYEER